jgi:hypothetical protein
VLCEQQACPWARSPLPPLNCLQNLICSAPQPSNLALTEGILGCLAPLSQCLHLYRSKETSPLDKSFLIHPFINEPLVPKTSRGKDMHEFQPPISMDHYRHSSIKWLWNIQILRAFKFHSRCIECLSWMWSIIAESASALALHVHHREMKCKGKNRGDLCF